MRSAADFYARNRSVLWRVVFFSVIVATLVLGWKAFPSAYPCNNCNVVLISVDSVRADRVGLLSGGSVTSNIDEFFERGHFFENYITSSYLTPISEMAVHTGRYPMESGVVGFGSLLPAKTLTLAERLKIEGYDTASFGTSPEFFYFLPAMTTNFSRGFDSYFEESKVATSSRDVYQLRSKAPEDAVRWVSARKPDDGKFFLWLALGTAHFPYGAWCEDQEQYSGWLKGKSLHWNNDTLRRMYNGQVWSLETPGVPLQKLTAEDEEYVRSCYDGNVRRA